MRTKNPTLSLFVWMAPALLLVVQGAGAGEPDRPVEMFVTSHECMACHNNLVDATGKDLSIGTDWRSSMMANSSRDPYWQGSVRRETLDHPRAAAAIEDECAVCHMPMARFTAHARGAKGRIFAHLPGGEPTGLSGLARDGVSCTLCHQIQPDRLGERASFVGRFEVDRTTPLGQRPIFGPFEVDAGRTRIMRSAALFEQKKAQHIRESALCGSCHTLYTHALGPDGEAIGELPEQMPYLEWQHSSYPGIKSCQSCHMIPVEGQEEIASVWGKPRPGFMQHVFRGGNFFVPRLLNRHRRTLQTAAQPLALQAASERTMTNLTRHTAGVELCDARLTGEQLAIAVRVHNRTGHKLPTAYPSRRAWLHLQVRDANGKVVFTSGALQPDGSIAGNANDTDATRYEPHYTTITAADQVQIYEPILGGTDGAVTTGLLTATRYLKDNRLLPAGFDKATAGEDIAVIGSARDDADFTAGSDRVVYRVALDGAVAPLTVQARLYYQPIGFRWARNLDDYQAEEPARFVRYYDQAAGGSAVALAADEQRVEPTGSATPPPPPPPPPAGTQEPDAP